MVLRRYLPSGPDMWLTQAANGPNYGVGPPEYGPDIIPTGLESGRTIQVPANYGSMGGYDRPLGWDNQRELGWWEFPAPKNNDNRPQWNVLPPQLTYGLRVMGAKQVAAYDAATRDTNVPIPVQFPSPRTASVGAVGK